MPLFVNEYKNTEAVITESVEAWCKVQAKGRYINLAICTLVVLIAFLYYRDLWMLLCVPIFIMCLIVLSRNKKALIKRELVAQKVIYKDTIPTFRVEIGQDIHKVTENSDTHISFSDVEKLVETTNLIVLFIRGNMLVTLDKKGFINSNGYECLDYLKNKMQKQ